VVTVYAKMKTQRRSRKEHAVESRGRKKRFHVVLFASLFNEKRGVFQIRDALHKTSQLAIARREGRKGGVNKNRKIS